MSLNLLSLFFSVSLQRMSCSYLLCTILLFVAVLLAVTVTGTILLMNHYQAPPMSDGPPHISTNQDEANALVTVERGDGSRINIFIDPNCPDYNSNFLRLEGVQTSLLHSLTDHDTDLKSVKGQDRALLVNLAEEVAKLSAHAGQLKMDYESLRRGQNNLGQDLNTLQTEQSRLIQVMTCTHTNPQTHFQIHITRPTQNLCLQNSAESSTDFHWIWMLIHHKVCIPFLWLFGEYFFSWCYQ